MLKNFAGEPFCAVFWKVSGSEEVCGWKGGQYPNFPSKMFCLTVPKFFVGQLFRVSLISVIEKCYGESVKLFGRAMTRTPNLLLENLVVLRLPLLFIIEIKRLGNIVQIKLGEKRSYWMNNFSCIFHIRRKIMRVTTKWSPVFWWIDRQTIVAFEIQNELGRTRGWGE